MSVSGNFSELLRLSRNSNESVEDKERFCNYIAKSHMIAVNNHDEEYVKANIPEILTFLPDIDFICLPGIGGLFIYIAGEDDSITLFGCLTDEDSFMLKSFNDKSCDKLIFASDILKYCLDLAHKQSIKREINSFEEILRDVRIGHIFSKPNQAFVTTKRDNYYELRESGLVDELHLRCNNRVLTCSKTEETVAHHTCNGLYEIKVKCLQRDCERCVEYNAICEHKKYTIDKINLIVGDSSIPAKMDEYISMVLDQYCEFKVNPDSIKVTKKD